MTWIFDNFWSLSNTCGVIKKQDICTFLPLPSSPLMTLTVEYYAILDAIMIPLAPIDCASNALLVNEHDYIKSVLMTIYVGLVRYW